MPSVRDITTTDSNSSLRYSCPLVRNIISPRDVFTEPPGTSTELALIASATFSSVSPYCRSVCSDTSTEICLNFVADPAPDVVDRMSHGGIDWVTVTSSAIARSLAKMFGETLRNCRLVSISPVTSQMLRELGYEPSAEATTYTIDGVVDAILS